MSFFLPGAAAFCAVAGLIVLLYMLKAHRPPVTVSSTMLWRRALGDARASVPWQRLRPNLLFMLQVLAVLLLTLALMRPYVLRAGAPRQNVVLVLDASLSTQTRDANGSRFQAETAWATQLIRNLPAGQTMSILRLDGHPAVLVAGSGDQQVLAAALAGQQPGFEQPDPQSAASLATGLAAQNRVSGGVARVVVLRSATTPTVPLPPGADSEDHVFGDPHTWDAGIARLGTARAPDGTMSVVASVFNTGTHPRTLDLDVYADGQLEDVQSVTLPPHGSTAVQSTGLPPHTRVIHMHLLSTDPLSADNQAWAVINAAQSGHVLLVSAANIFLSTALQGTSGIAVTQVAPAQYTAALANRADLTIFDGYLPRALPQSSLLLIHPTTTVEGIGVGGSRAVSSLSVDDDPAGLLRYLQPAQLHIARTVTLVPPVWMHVALRDRQGPLILEGSSPLGNRVAVIGFDLHTSDLPLSADFPVLIARLIQWAVPGSLVNQPAVQPGQPVQISLPADSTRLRIILPDGSNEPLAAGGNLLRPGSVPFGDTQMPGVYRLDLTAAGKPLEAAFAVNVAPATQSPAPATPQEPLQTAATAPAKAGSVPEELTGGIIVLVLCLLAGEWFIAMRRR